MQNFRKLQAYIIAKDLVKFVYTLLQKFPQEERYGLCDQLRRSVISTLLTLLKVLDERLIKIKDILYKLPLVH